MMLSAKDPAPWSIGRYGRGYGSQENWIQSGNDSSPTLLSSGSHPTRVSNTQADCNASYPYGMNHNKHDQGNSIASTEPVHFK